MRGIGPPFCFSVIPTYRVSLHSMIRCTYLLSQNLSSFLYVTTIDCGIEEDDGSAPCGVLEGAGADVHRIPSVVLATCPADLGTTKGWMDL